MDEVDGTDGQQTLTAETLKRIRKRMHLSQSGFAAKAGVSPQTVVNIENGRRPSLTTTRRIYAAVGDALEPGPLLIEDGEKELQQHEETFDVSASTDLLQLMVDDEHVTSRDDLVEIWGVSRRSINYKLAGRSPVSLEEWARLFRETGDVRIPHLLLARTDFGLFKTPRPGSTDEQSITTAHDELAGIIERSADFTIWMTRVLRDRRIDHRDAEGIAAMRDLLPELIYALKTANARIESMYDAWLEQARTAPAKEAAAI